MFKAQQKSEPFYLAVISDADSRRNMRKLYPSWSNGDEEGASHFFNAQRVYFNEDSRQCEDNKVQKDPVTGPQNNITEMFCKVVKEQSAPQVDLDLFDGNPLEYTYFMSMFKESVEKKIENPKGKLTRLIQCTRGEAKDLIINDRPEYEYNNAMAILHRQYGNPHTLLSSYRREVRQMVPLKAGYATAFRKLFNFLIKC